jgi:hypothetical protein
LSSLLFVMTRTNVLSGSGTRVNTDSHTRIYGRYSLCEEEEGNEEGAR